MGKAKPETTATARDDQPTTFDRHFVVDNHRFDEETGELELSVSSEKPVQRWFGWEILRHNHKAVDLTYLRSVGTMLWNHDPDEVVGPIHSVRVEGGKLRIRTSFDETARGQQTQTQVRSGSVRGVSIRYTFDPKNIRRVEDGEKEFGLVGPGYDVKRWKPIHTTYASEPADDSVGVGRARETTEHNPGASAAGERVTLTRGESMADNDTKSDQAAPPAGDRGGGAVDTMALKREGADEERKRQVAIRGFGEIAGQRELAEKCIEENFSIEAAHALLRKAWEDAKKAAAVDTGIPPEPKQGSNGKARKLSEVDEDTVVRALSRRSWVEPATPIPGALSLGDLRSLLRNDQGDFDRHTMALLKAKKLRPEQISIRAAYDALWDSTVTQYVEDPASGQLRAVVTSAFPVLTGNTVINRITEAFEGVPVIGDQLVREYRADEAVTRIARLETSDAAMPEVKEGADYTEMSAGEGYFTIGDKKYGRVIRITDEMVRRDQTGLVLSWAGTLGEMMAKWREKLTLNRVCDTLLNGVYVYQPSGTNTALYSTVARAHGTNKKAANPLADNTDLDFARALLAAMTDDAGEPILATADVLLIPDALLTVAQKILNSELVPGIANEVSAWGPRGAFRPRLLSSPYLDTFTNGTTSWYLGNPARQFIRKTSVEMETTQMGQTSEDMFKADIKAQFKVRWAGEVGADGYEYFIQSTAA